MSEERAVSNVLGYFLLFSIVLLSITTTFTFGLDTLERAQGDNVRGNAEQAMTMLGERLESMRESNTTIRRSQIRTRRGTIGDGDQTRVIVRVDGTTELDTTFRPIRYEFDGTTVAYEAGAMLRTNDDGGGTLVEEPSFVLANDAVVLPITTTAPAARRSISGSAVTVELSRVASRRASFGTGSKPVEIEIQTTERRAAVWERTLSERGASCSITSPGTVECGLTTNADATIVVREFRVSYAFET